MEIIVETAGRKIKRDINKTLSNDIFKYIAEILTNSDDSYSRLEGKGIISETPSSITIIYNRLKKQMTVVDRAEGMNVEDLQKKFGKYGAFTSESSEVKRVRGMFGQGASDVLFSAALNDGDARIITIKDDICTEALFMIEGENVSRKIVINKIKPNIIHIREKYNIPNNGTVVTFSVPNKVSVPRFLDFVNKLSNYYMFNFILSNPKRIVEYVEINGTSEQHAILRYDESIYLNSEVLLQKPIEVKYQEATVNGIIDLRKNDNKSEFVKGLLIYDENNIVYDQDSFGYQNFPGMEKLEGRIKLIGVSSLIEEYLNHRNPPEEILKDNRDGFDENHDFYKNLELAVKDYIRLALDKINDSKDTSRKSTQDDKEFKDAFKEINKYFKEVLEEIAPVPGMDNIKEPPSDGMRFVRQNINITTGKKYAIKLLVNINMIPIDSLIEVSTESIKFELSPSILKVTNESIVSDGLAVLNLTVTGIEATELAEELEAKYDHLNAKLFVRVINEEIHYPAYGMEFFPNKLTKKPGIKSKGHLYIDINKFPLGTVVKLETLDGGLELSLNEFVLDELYLISSDIAKINVECIGGELDCNYKVTARARNYATDLEVVVSESEEAPINKGGLISDYDWRAFRPGSQTYHDPNNGKIYINTENPINITVLQSCFSNVRSKYTKEEKRYIAELCSERSALVLIKEKIDKGKIESENFEAYHDEVVKEKTKIYNIFLSVFK